MSSRYPQGRQSSSLTPKDSLRKLSKKVQTDHSRPMIFVGGIPQIVRRTEAMLYAEQFGRLLHFDMPVKKTTALHHSFCKLVFERPSDAETFLSYADGHYLGDTLVGASRWVERDQHVSLKEVPTENKLFFKFKTAVTTDQLSKYFGRFGIVEQVEIKQNHVTQQKRDFGFVYFADSSAAQAVLEKNTEHLVSGHIIKVYPSRLNSEIYNAKTTTDTAQRSRNSLLTPEHEYTSVDGKTSSQAIYKQYSMAKTIQPIEVTTTKPSTRSILLMPTKHLPVSIPVSITLSMREVYHKVKPCSKHWRHMLISQNHNRAENLTFNIVKPCSISHY
jgi:RNA recognition motif-containing protein